MWGAYGVVVHTQARETRLPTSTCRWTYTTRAQCTLGNRPACESQSILNRPTRAHAGPSNDLRVRLALNVNRLPDGLCISPSVHSRINPRAWKQLRHPLASWSFDTGTQRRGNQHLQYLSSSSNPSAYTGCTSRRRYLLSINLVSQE